MTVLPSVFDREKEIRHKISKKKPFLFLDYDGTLTPIVDRPQDAILHGNMRNILSDLADLCTVAIISGRKREEIESLIKLPNLIYAGTHGFDIRGPNINQVPPDAISLRPLIKRVYQEILQNLGDIRGCIVEDKKFAIAVHFRLVNPTEIPKIEDLLDEIAKRESGIKKTTGKMVLELRADIPWDKGTALLFLLKTLIGTGSDALPLYLGDDDTDEDAFLAISDNGIGILVAETEKPTAAKYRLSSPHEVEMFLTKLSHWLKRNPS